MSLLDPARRRLVDSGSDVAAMATATAPLREAPLSPGQERLWFLLKSLPDAAAYNMAVTISLPDHLSPALARAAWDMLVDRHAALRTLITATDEGPRQRLAVDTASRPGFEVVDLATGERRSGGCGGTSSTTIPARTTTSSPRGGHSLLLLRLHAAIETELGVRLDIGELMEASRFDAMAALVGAREPVAPDAVDPLVLAAGPRAPATPAQCGVWYAEQSSPGAYHLPLRLEYREAVVPGALAVALEWLVTRHAALRTVFTPSATGLVQQVLEPPGPLLRSVDPTGNPIADQWVDRVLAADAERRFDLGVEPPVRGVAVTVASSHHVVQLTFHHIAVDGLSMDIVRRDFDRFYRTASRGRRTPPTPLVPSYLDHARMVAEHRTDPALQARAAQILEGAELRTPLPFDRPPGPARSAAGVVVAFALPEEWIVAVDRVVRSTSTTRFAVLAAAWLAFVAELSGADDLVVGTPLANRPAGLADTVGCFVNTLPLRVRVDEDTSWHGLSSAVADRVAGLLEVQEVALGEVVSRRRRAGVPEAATTFDTCFVVQDGVGVGSPQWAPSRPTASKFDLTVTLEATHDGVQGFLEARRSRLDDATAEVWARWFCAFAESLAPAPDRPAARRRLDADGADAPRGRRPQPRGPGGAGVPGRRAC